MKNPISADTPPTLTFGYTQIGSPDIEAGYLANGGSASALEQRSVIGLLQSGSPAHIYEWGLAGQASSHVTRYDPITQTRHETVIVPNCIAHSASIDESTNEILLVQEDLTTIVAIDGNTMQETRRRYLGRLPGPVVDRFADSSTGSIWLICRVDPERVFVEIRMDTFEFGRTLTFPSAIEPIASGNPGTHYFRAGDRVHVFDSNLGDFVADYAWDLGSSYIANAIHVPQLNQLLVSASGGDPRLRTFDAETLDPLLNIPVPVLFYTSMFYREQDGLVYGFAQLDTLPTVVVVNPTSGEFVAEQITGYDLAGSLGTYGYLLQVLYDPDSDVATFVTTKQAMGSFPGGSLDITPARPIRPLVSELLTDPTRKRIWMIGTVSSTRDWIEYYDAETMEILGSIERPTSQGMILSQRIDESTGDLQLEVRTTPRSVIHVNRETMAIETRANLEYTSTSVLARSTLAGASTGELYAFVPSTPPRVLMFPAGSSVSTASATLPTGSVALFLVHDEVMGRVSLATDNSGVRELYWFGDQSLSPLGSVAINDWLITQSVIQEYHPPTQEVLIAGFKETGEVGIAGVSTLDGTYREIRRHPNEPHYRPRFMASDPYSDTVHILCRLSSGYEWLELSPTTGRLRTYGIFEYEGFGYLGVISHNPAPRIMGSFAGVLKSVDASRLSFRPFDYPISRIHGPGQTFHLAGSSHVLISREINSNSVRRSLSPSFIETSDWKSRRILDHPIGIITGQSADITALPTTPPTIAVAANAQFVEVSILDRESMQELSWTGLDPNYGEAAWMAHNPTSNHLVIGTVRDDGGGHLLVLDADSLDLVEEMEFSSAEGTPLIGVVDPILGNVIVGLDGPNPALARFSLPALNPMGLVMLEGLGLPSRGGAAVDANGRRAYFVLRPFGRRVSINLESFAIHSSALSTSQLPPMKRPSTYEVALNPGSGLGYVAGEGDDRDSVRVHEFSLADCQQTRNAVGMDPISSFVGGDRPFAMAYDQEEDLLVLGGGYFMHTTFRELVNKVRMQVPQRISADQLHFYSHAADGQLNFGIYTDAGSNFRERIWESGPIANTAEDEFLTVPVKTDAGDPVILEPGRYFITWRTNSRESVGSLTTSTPPTANSIPWPFDVDSPMLPHKNLGAFPAPWTIVGAWTFYLEATPVEDPLTGWAIY